MLNSLLCAALLACVLPASAASAEVDDDLTTGRTARVRPHDGRSAAALLQGMARSETMRMLVERLEAQNVIVYIEMRPTPSRQLAGRMVWLSSASNFRYVRVSLNPELSGETLIAVLAHELQHVTEVAMTPSIVDEVTLEAYYRKNGISMRSHANGWDTFAARDTGELVRRELADSPLRTAIESVQPFDPSSWHVVYRRARDRFIPH